MNALPLHAGAVSNERRDAVRATGMAAGAVKPHFFACTLLAVVCSLLFLYRLGDRDLLSSHEARAAQNAQMLLSDGDWGLPRLFNGRVELQKPPLYYWLVAALGWLAGGHVDGWTVRLPAALAAAGCVFFLYYLGAKLGRPRMGLFAALILATFVHFTWLARVARIDMPLTLSVTVAIGCLYLGALGFSRGWLIAGYTAVAFGVLLKGPIAVMLVGVVWVVFRTTGFRSGPGGKPKSIRVLSYGVPIVLLLAGPWFLWANWRTDNALWDMFFWHHNVERGLGASETLGRYPVWYYLPRLAIDLLPWSLALPFVIVASWRRRLWPEDRELRLGVLWLIAVVGLLSCMSFKRADYLLPAYPGVALALGSAVDRLWKAKTATALIGGGAIVLYSLGWLIFVTWFADGAGGDRPYQRMAADLRNLTHRPVIFFRTEAHALMYHVGRPLDTILEWENLEVWANQRVPVYFVMPPECAIAWSEHLRRGRLERVLDSGDYFGIDEDRPLVVMRSCP